MARNKSVILTPAERKEAIGTNKAAAKELQAKIKELEGRGKIAKRTYDSDIKDLQRQITAKAAEYEKAEKARNKELAGWIRDLEKVQGKLDELNPPKAEPSPIEPPRVAIP
jgi:DNA repair exonuclease SbcCD ATPase subunit